MTTRPHRAGFLALTTTPGPTRPTPGRPTVKTGASRAVLLQVLAGYDDGGVHPETLAVHLWSFAPAVWGMKRHPEHPDLRTVVARLSDLRTRGLVESCPGGCRLTGEGRRAARDVAAATKSAARAA